jgi:hypothetical protein
MHMGCLLTWLELFAVSLLCIGQKAVNVIRGAYGMVPDTLGVRLPVTLPRLLQRRPCW